MTKPFHLSRLLSERGAILLLFILFCGIAAQSAQKIYLYPGESYTIQPPSPTSYNGYISNVVIPASTDFLEITKNYDYSVTIKPLTYFVSVTIPMIFIETYRGSYDGHLHTLQHEKEYDLYIKMPKFTQDENTVTIKVGESKKLTFKTEPSDLPTPYIEWGTVLGFGMGIKLTNDGVVTGEYETSAKVMALPYGDQRFMMLWNINVITIKPETVSLPKTETVKYGETITLQPTFTPSDASAKLTWVSSNEDVATVNSNGKVTPKKTGKTTIAVKTDNDLSASCEVTVEKGDVTLNCDKESDLYAKGTKITLTANRSDAEIYYTLDGSTPTSSSNHYTSPIAINENLTLKAIAMGSEYNPSSVVTRTFEVTELKDTKHDPIDKSYDRKVFPEIEFSDNITESTAYHDITLKGSNETAITGIPIIKGKTLYYIPDEPLPLGSYTFTCPTNAVKGLMEGPNLALEHQFVIEQWTSMSDTEKIKKVAVGRDFSLALQNNGTLWVWGYNNHGQLGIGNTESVTTPTELLNGIKDIAAGQYFSMALKKDGTLWTWGKNESGQLGNGTKTDSYSPISIMNNIEKVAAGYWHSLALTTDGTLYAWGSNSYGQIGDKTEEKKMEPIKIMSDVSSIACGTRHSLAIKKDGSLWAWGDNGYNQLGDGTSEDRSYPVKVMDNIVKVAGGSCFTVAVKTDGSLWRWGSDETDVPKEPQKIMDNVEDIATKGYRILIRKKDNTLWYSRFYHYTPVKIMEDVTVIATMNHCLAAKKDGTLWSWGDFEEGQLGYDYQEPYRPMETTLDFDKIVFGRYHALGIKKDGTLWAWGNNEQGQLGDGTNEERCVPAKILTNVSYTYARGNCSLAITTDGNLYMWGENNTSQLGDGSTTNRNKPVKVLSGVKDATTGEEFSVALKNDGSFWEWGRSPNSQKYSKPVKVMDGIKKAVAGGYHEVIVKNDNSLWIRKNGREQFTKIMDDVNDVSAGDEATFAIKNDKSLWSWGSNIYGELGDGTTKTQNDPVKIYSNVKNVIANDSHTFVVDDTGNLFACGKNQYGELGDGTKSSKKNLVKIATEIQSASSGNYCSSAIRNDGKVLLWGSNDYGQFGNGEFSPRYHPRSVSTEIFRESTTTGVTIESKHVLSIGENFLLLPNLNPSNAFYKKISFDSSDEQVASVSSRGIITAKQVGTATITVTVDEKFTATCVVTVIDENEIRIEISTHGTVTSSVTKAKQGESVTLTVKPDNGYMLETLGILAANDSRVEYQRNGETITFVMPASAVTVSASFIKAMMAVRTSAAGYATFFDSGWAFSLPNGLSARVVTGVSNGKLSYKTLTGGLVPKDVAVMLETSQKRAADYTLTRTESTATYTGTNLLHGSDETTTTTGDGYHYKLTYGPSSDSNLKDVFGWYWGTQNGDAFQIEGHKAWLVVPKSAGARSFSVDGEANGIIGIDTESAESSRYYDLQGRRVSQPTKKGLYIKDGKKIVNK